MPDKKFSKQDLELAWIDLQMLAFPPPEAARAAVMDLLRRMCPHRMALRWLIDEVVNHVGKWPGTAELRGILCTRFDPADGIDQWSALPGYSAVDQEVKFLAGHQETKAAQKQLAPEARDMLRQLSAGVKRIQ